MIKVTIFGGHEGVLNFDTHVYLTIFAACEVVRPTLARQLVARRQARRDLTEDERGMARGWSGRPGHRHDRPVRGKPFFITAFGGTEIRSPTLAEEFVDFQKAIDSGLLTMDDCERSIADLGMWEGSIGSFTIFGGFEEGASPSEDKEIDSLAIQRHLGTISESAGRVLQLGIGQSEGERRAVLRQAMLAEA
jgi:hypothetical protein